MEKVRVYQLAKELNTTSKRLMEKLAEINIKVKNHMSLLDNNELNALYDHIGVIRRDGDNKADRGEKAEAPAASNRTIQGKDERKDSRDIPTIIRKTEIIIDTKPENKENKNFSRQNKPKASGRNDRRNSGNGWEVIRASDASSGLRAGFTRQTKTDLRKELMKAATSNSKVSENIKKAAKENADAKIEVKPEVKHEVKQETKPQANAEVTNNRPEVKRGISERAKAPVKGTDRRDVKDETVSEPVNEMKNDKKTVDKEKQAAVKENMEKVASGNNVAVKAEGRRSSGSAGQTRAQSGKPNENRSAAGKDVQKRERNAAQDQRNDSKRRTGDTPRQDARKPTGGRSQADRKKPFGEQRKPSGHPTMERKDTRDGSRKMGTSPRKLDIPAPEMPAGKVEVNDPLKTEIRRESMSRDIDKGIKREQKREVPKVSTTGRTKKVRPQSIVLNEKKGVSEVLSEDFILEEFYDDGVKKTRKAARPRKDGRNARNSGNIKDKPVKAVLTSIKIPESLTVKELAESLKKTATEVIKKLMSAGIMATLNQEVDFDTAAIIADEFGVKAEKEIVINEEDILFDESDEGENMQPRPPVVVVMGHVDHGKTSLLDAIREGNVTESEAGGITQHIGAYMVNINNRKMTFLDTPGHEAFTAMRARGAQVTDIAVLVVAADDGIMPQTVEAINHAKAANVAIIVAINKIDKPGANPDRVKQELTEHNLVPEEWGGDIICVPVSAKNRENIDQLLEMVLLTADMLELRADPDKQAKGTIVEAKLDKSRGSVATLLVQRGTLQVGDSIVTGTTVGRIRAMTDDKGKNIKKAGPSTPVEITGLPEVPEAGEVFYAITDEKVAKHLAEKRKTKQREETLRSTSRVSLDDLFSQIQEGKVKELNIIVKADVQGSVEAVKQSLEKLSNDEVRINTIHGGVGAITESDVNLAQVSNAIIIGFNVRPGANVADIAEDVGVDMRLYRVIYDAIEDVEAAMKGMLEPVFKEVVLGHTEVRQIFKASGVGTIGGCYVTNGKITRNSEVRVVRDGVVIHEGKLASLKRFKDDAKEVMQGFECGLSIERFNDIKVGDVVESYIMEKVER